VPALIKTNGDEESLLLILMLAGFLVEKFKLAIEFIGALV
jgi:hypothetical protein